ncbi:MAG: hypothetical protein JWQ71_519 [Pedosphaera sp.]|nr:hypothetical protein [Pedosphaera sp.]
MIADGAVGVGDAMVMPEDLCFHERMLAIERRNCRAGGKQTGTIYCCEAGK